ncbi:TlpA family protein disulfide reductase [Algoriphagus terrigena]|uniref:TlpA family protein disulfide reductase n=1 Tax=Algoriphagus terrigena TaxID=344884 RepID=UPI00041956BB|nr:TlpA disulfide reductase family protein [Algoriphagus terrigena]
MKKNLFTCFLALLCLAGSPSSAQGRVADSPPGFSLVDTTGSVGQEGGIPSARVGEGSVLIYGELVNPDSLAPLLLVTTPYYLDPNSSYLRSEQEIVPQPGEFFDGVLNPKVQKFSAVLELGARPGYFSLLLGDRPLLEDFLVYPDDSLKLSLDLLRMEVLFAGRNAAFYEAQYAVKREQRRSYFDAPRQLITSRNAKLFKRPESLAKMAEFEGQFGAELLVLEPGKESLDYLLAGLENPVGLERQIAVLDRFADQLSLEEYDLLRAETVCGFYYSGLSSYRKFHHPYVESLPEAEKNAYRNRVGKLISEVKGQDFGLETRLVSAAFMNLGLELVILDAIWEGKSFLAAVDEAYSGEVADRIRAAYLSNYLSALPDQENYINKFLAVTKTYPWRERILSLERSHIPGDTIIPVSMVGLDGKTYDREDLTGKPTLLYFYFSTCSHSADYFKKHLFPLYQQTADLGYQLIAVSVDQDPELWKSRIDRYSDPSILNLNLREEDKERWRSYYELYAYPKTMLLDEAGRIVDFDIRNLGTDSGSFRAGFLKLYHKEILHTPFPANNL